MQDVSSIGINIRLIASQTFPLGINLNAFPEEGENGPGDSTEIANNASGVNGDLIVWKVTNGIEYTLNLIPNTEQEALMDTLLQANRGAKNRFPKKDVITIVEINPVTGVIKTYKNGWIKSGPVGYRYGNDGRIRNKAYSFVFEDCV